MLYVVANRLIWAGSKLNKGIEEFTKSCIILKLLLKFQIVNDGLVKLVSNIYFSSFNKLAGHLNVLNITFLVPSRVNYKKDLIDQPFFRIKFLYTNDKCTAWDSGEYNDNGKHWSTGFLTGNHGINSLISFTYILILYPIKPTGL